MSSERQGGGAAEPLLLCVAAAAAVTTGGIVHGARQLLNYHSGEADPGAADALVTVACAAMGFLLYRQSCIEAEMRHLAAAIGGGAAPRRAASERRDRREGTPARPPRPAAAVRRSPAAAPSGHADHLAAPLTPPAAAAAPADPAELQRADELYGAQQWQALVEYVAHPGRGGGAELLWRRARARHELAIQPGPGQPPAAAGKIALLTEALDDARAAVAADDRCAQAHLWVGIATSALGDAKGVKAKIAVLMEMKQAWLRALDVEPTHATALNLLGRWCHGVANTSWVERKLAAAIFGSLPQASVAEALEFFERAEAASPGTYKNNQVMMGKCLIALNRRPEARRWLEGALRVEQKTEEDRRDHAEAQKMLQGL